MPAITDLMNVQTYAATVARLADAVPRHGAQQIAQILNCTETTIRRHSALARIRPS